MSEADNIKLRTEGTDLRSPGEHFEVSFPKDLSEESYQYLRWNLEYRRRCMNQGFDNLIELLDHHWQAFQKAKEQVPAVTPEALPPRE